MSSIAHHSVIQKYDMLAFIAHHHKSKIWLELLTYKIIIYTLLIDLQNKETSAQILCFVSKVTHVESYDVSDDCVYLEKRTSEIVPIHLALHIY